MKGKAWVNLPGHFSKLNKKKITEVNSRHVIYVHIFYRVPEGSYFDASDLLGEVFVDTMDTVSDYVLIAPNNFG